MATIIQGDASTFSALAMGEMHPGTQQYLNTQMETPTHTLTDQGRQFLQNTQSLFDRIAESRSMRRVKAVKRAIGEMWQSDEIRHLSTIGEFQWAPDRMQRWLMAEPTIRDMYHKQRLEGYQGTYRDAYPDDIGENHYDYRRATNGFVFVKDEPEDDEPEWTSITYYDDLEPDDRELELVEQSDIIDSWANVKSLVYQGEDDPTSRHNASL